MASFLSQRKQSASARLSGAVPRVLLFIWELGCLASAWDSIFRCLGGLWFDFLISLHISQFFLYIDSPTKTCQVYKKLEAGLKRGQACKTRKFHDVFCGPYFAKCLFLLVGAILHSLKNMAYYKRLVSCVISSRNSKLHFAIALQLM